MDKTSNDYIINSLGYLSISILSALSGYVLYISFVLEDTVGSNIFDLKILIVLAFTLLLLPYLISREVLLEQEKLPKLDNVNIRTTAKQIPMYLLFFLTFIYILIGIILYTTHILNTEYLLQLSILYIIGLSSFIYLYCRSNYLLQHKKGDIAYSFLESILLPALYVCIIPFSIGWSISGNSINFEIILIASGYLFILSFLVFKFNGISNKINFLIIFIYSIIILLILYLFNPLYSKFLLTSISFTLILGISEVTKRVYLSSEHHKEKKNYNRYIPTIKNTKENYTFYFKSGKQLGITLPLLLPIITLLWSSLSSPEFFLIAYVQIIHWFFIIRKKDISLFDFWFSMFLGFFLPTIIVLKYYLNFSLNIIPTIDRDISVVLELFAGFIAMFSMFFLKKLTSDLYKSFTKFLLVLVIFVFIIFSYMFMRIISLEVFFNILASIGYLVGLISLIVHWNRLKKVWED